MQFKWFDIERIIHSTKTAIAVLLGILLVKFISLPNDQWVVITIIVVMCGQIYVGSVLKRSYLRFLGTLIGCLFAIITILTTQDSLPSIILTIALSSFLFSYLATSNENFVYAGTLGAVTTAIILLGPIHTVTFAVQRLGEISAGILIAALVSQFILPIHAKTHLKRSQAKVLSQLKAYYIACMITHDVDFAANYYEDLDENIIKSLTKQRQLAKEAVSEPFGMSYDRKRFMQSLYCEKEILRAIDFMHYTVSHIKNIAYFTHELTTIANFNTLVIQNFDLLIKQIEVDVVTEEPLHLPSLHLLTNEFNETRTGLSPKDSIYIDGFLCAAEILTDCLKQLAKASHLTIHEESVSPALPNAHN
ncbi:MAG: FUSC family protein [Gammaproteobacteria bacterium]|nr:FUSC family protein [Gammaproteobacteria bacterium]